MIKIRTDHKWKPFLYRDAVPARVLASEFDYLDPEDGGFDGFMRRRGEFYHLSQFVRAPSELGGWDGYMNHSFSSGIVIKVSPDGESYKIGYFWVISDNA